jgi:F-box-like
MADPYGGPYDAPGQPLSPGGTQQAVRWIPVDVKVHWFSFLSVPDLARASRVCKSWTSLVQKTCDAQFAQTIGTTLPHLARPAKLRLLDRLHHAYLPENMAYLLSWAVTSRGLLRTVAANSSCLDALSYRTCLPSRKPLFAGIRLAGR